MSLSIGILGRAMVMVSCIGIGYYLGNKVKMRRTQLLLSAQMLGMLTSRLGFHLQAAGELVEEIAQEQSFCSLIYLQRFCEEKGQSFPLRWRSAIEKEKGELTQSDKDLLLQIGHILGAYDLDSQQEELEHLRNQLEYQAKLLEQQEERDKKLYPVMGPLAGLALCILL